uniref:Large ribosomal subunit protein mL38 n=1 Tax=Anopheles epiroticus TaxID=199890 RepID=A0A182PWP7_9DIPT
QIHIDQVRIDWLETNGPFHIKQIAEHYGVYEHLFGNAFFVPRVALNIQYQCGESLHHVRFGNILKPSETQLPPRVQFDANINLTCNSKGKDVQSLWSLLLTNPDGHFEQNEKEYCHWFVGNIPNGDLKSGDELIPYLQPFPAKATGYQRYIFILYKQTNRINFSQYRQIDPYDLPARTFRTLDFYRQYQDHITPAGLAFFQSDWDASLPEFYHKKLQLQHPVFEYHFPASYIREQEWFPLRKPFNTYMDKYRDSALIRKEYLIRKFANTHPFEESEAPLRFPNAHPINDVPSWLGTEIRKDRLGWGRINDV